MRQPIVGHLDPFFFQVNEEIRRALQLVWGTRNEFTMVISGTGSAGMECVVANFVEPGAKFLIFVNGYFGERLSEMSRRHGATLVRAEKPWGEVFSDDEARAVILRERPAVVAFVHAETSTGALQRGHAIAAAAREVGALTIADCVTSLGGMPIDLDAMGVDIAYAGTQKALGCPPGLAPITCNERAVECLRQRKSTPVTWYLDLKLLLDYYEQAHRYHHTAPISMFYALRESLAIIEDEGLAARFARHEANHKLFAEGVAKLGMPLIVNAADRLWTLNTPSVPAGIDELKVRKSLMQRHSIEIAGGLGSLAGRVFRIGTMGYGSTKENVAMLLGALEEALAEQRA